jgi:cytochrome c peroxidase
VKAGCGLLSIATAMIAAALSSQALVAQESSPTLSPEALQEIAQVEAEIDRIEAQTIERLAALPDNQVQQVELLGKLLLYDKQLSVNRNEACAFCHMPEVGFTGPVSELNRTTGSYPGSVRTRFSQRKPQTHAYAPLSPVLHYNPGQGDLVGGNFWDGTCVRPAAGWATRSPSRRKGRRRTPSKWAYPTSPARSIAPRRDPIAPALALRAPRLRGDPG